MKSVDNGSSPKTFPALTITNGTSYITIIPPAVGTYTLTLPPSTGTVGQVLTTDGTGVTSWTTIDTPNYGVRYKPSPQTVSSGITDLVQWNDSVTGILTSDGINLTNNTGRTVSILVTVTLLWDPAVGGGLVTLSLRKSGGGFIGRSEEPVFGSSGYATCTITSITSLTVGEGIYCEAFNGLGGSLDIKGGAEPNPIVSRMFYYTLN